MERCKYDNLQQQSNWNNLNLISYTRLLSFAIWKSLHPTYITHYQSTILPYTHYLLSSIFDVFVASREYNEPLLRVSWGI